MMRSESTSGGRVMWLTVAVLVLTITWNGLRLAGGAFGDLFMLMAFAAAGLDMLVRRRALVVPPWLALAGIGYLLAGLLSVIFPPSVGLANKAIVQQESLLTVPGYLPPRSDLIFLVQFLLSAMVIPLLMTAAGGDRRRCRALLDIWTVGVFLSAVVGVADFAGIAHLAPYPIVANRSSGLTIHPNYLALSSVMAIPSAMIWIGRSRRWTVAGVVVVLTLLGGVYASGSRAGTVAAVGAIALTAVLLPRFRAAIVPLLPFLGMTLIVVVLFTKLGSQIIHQVRLGGGDASAAGSNAQRTTDAQLALTQIAARPLQGVGFSVIQDAHDIYLQLLAAGGAIALGSFLVFIGGLFDAARSARSGPLRDEAVATTVAVLVWLANGVFDNQLADKYLYVIPGLLLAASLVARRDAATTGEPVPCEVPRGQPLAALRVPSTT